MTTAEMPVRVVEELTATVRVLRVGTRSLTQAAVVQLDTVAFDDLVPFGRVRLPRWRDMAIGRDAKGNLVRSPEPWSLTHWRWGQDGYELARSRYEDWDRTPPPPWCALSLTEARGWPPGRYPLRLQNGEVLTESHAERMPRRSGRG